MHIIHTKKAHKLINIILKTEQFSVLFIAILEIITGLLPSGVTILIWSATARTLTVDSDSV